MYLKKCMAVLLSVALALCLLTGCGGSTYSSELRIAINDAQTILDDGGYPGFAGRLL